MRKILLATAIILASATSQAAKMEYLEPITYKDDLVGVIVCMDGYKWAQYSFPKFFMAQMFVEGKFNNSVPEKC